MNLDYKRQCSVGESHVTDTIIEIQNIPTPVYLAMK